MKYYYLNCCECDYQKKIYAKRFKDHKSCPKCGSKKTVSSINPPFPKIVCLCGSTRFYKEYQIMNYRLTMKGYIVLSVGFYPHTKIYEHGEGKGITKKQKIFLDELHKRKIDLCDEVFVINVDGYIGKSTRSEIEYTKKLGKPIIYLEVPQ